MGWVENHIEEIEEHMIEIMKDKFKEYGLDTFFTTPDDLDDLVDPYYWSVDNLGDEIANQLSRDAEQAFLERGIP